MTTIAHIFLPSFFAHIYVTCNGGSMLRHYVLLSTLIHRCNQSIITLCLNLASPYFRVIATNVIDSNFISYLKSFNVLLRLKVRFIIKLEFRNVDMNQ